MVARLLPLVTLASLSALGMLDAGSPSSFKSLVSLNDAGLFAYMESPHPPGSAATRQAKTSTLPANFWELAPAESMLALLEQSRTATQRNRFDLVLESEHGARPPEITRLSLDDSPSQCYSTGSRHYFFNNQPGNSYYASGRVRTPGGARLYDAVHSPTTYELIFAPLDRATAAALGERIASLSQIQVERRRDYRSTKGEGIGSMWSSGDGRGYLRWWAPQDPPESPTTWSGGLWAGIDLTKRFTWRLGEEERLNFAHILLAREFPLHAGIVPATDDEAGEVAIMAILERFSLDERQMSLPIVQIAAEAAGDRVLASARPQLEVILDQTPRAAPTTGPLLDKENDLQAQIWSLAPKLRDYGVRYRQTESDIPEAQALINQQQKLIAERKSIDLSPEERDRFAFQQSLEVALKKIEHANDTEALKSWVQTESYGARWALRRLHTHHPKAYADALESHMAATVPAEQGDVLSRIYNVDPERGELIARERIESAEEDGLFIDCFTILQRADAIPNESIHVRRLIEIIRADYTNNFQRARALRQLVPIEEPTRYDDPEVDEALLYVISSHNRFPDKGYNYANAANALLRRDAPRYFPTIIQNIDQITQAHQKERLLGQLARYAKQLKPADHSACLNLIRAELKQAQNNLNSLLWIIWTADLRELAPEVQSLATHSPEEGKSPDTYQGNTAKRSASGTSHLARQIQALWSEPDPGTRAKLHIAFAYQHAQQFNFEREGQRVAVFRQSLEAATRPLPLNELAELVEFSKWCAQQATAGTDKAKRAAQLHEWLERKILKIDDAA